MTYTLKLFDVPLLQFQVVENVAEPLVNIVWIDSAKEHLLPLDLEPTNESLSRWIRHRTIPKNRAYVQSFLAKCGLNANRPMDVISVCRGLSLNDSYWVTEESDPRSFEKSNLFDNRFSEILAWTAFTGYGSSVRSSFSSSPEFTTNGMLPKCWRRIEGNIYLFKGATSGYSNAGCEPYSEMYASQIGKAMGVSAIPYGVHKWKGNLCSVCELFTSKEVSYVPIGRVVREGGLAAVKRYYASLGEHFTQALQEMIVFDAIICNTDRHNGNFGLLVDSRTRKILSPAPLFDHGNSLFNFAGEERWASEQLLNDYIDTLLPVAYDDFIGEAKKALNHELREKVRPLLDFHLEKQGKWNYPAKKLKVIEQQVQKRAQMILAK